MLNNSLFIPWLFITSWLTMVLVLVRLLFLLYLNTTQLLEKYHASDIKANIFFKQVYYLVIKFSQNYKCGTQTYNSIDIMSMCMSEEYFLNIDVNIIQKPLQCGRSSPVTAIVSQLLVFFIVTFQSGQKKKEYLIEFHILHYNLLF